MAEGIPSFTVDRSASAAGATPRSPEREKARADLTFTEIQRRLNNQETTGNYRRYLTEVRSRAIEDIESLDDGAFLESIRDRIREELPEISWDGKNGVTIRLTEIADYYDRQLTENGGRKSWKGLIPIAMSSEIARLKLEGIVQWEGKNGKPDPKWRAEHGYDKAKIALLGKLANDSHIYNLIPQNAEKIVGTKVGTESASGLNAVAKSMEKVGKVLSGEVQLELPENLEQQRILVRELLETVEKSNKDCNDPVNSVTVRKLEVSLENMFPEIAEEVVTRLAVHDSAELVKQAAGFVEPRKDGGINITAALGESDRRGHGLSQRVVEVFYKEGLKGLNLPKAWDLLEDANFHYRDVIDELNTLTIRSLSDQRRLSGVDRGRLVQILSRINYDPTKLEEPRHAADKAWVIRKIGQDNVNRFLSIEYTTVSAKDASEGKVPTNFYTDSNVGRSSAIREFIIAKLASEVDTRTRTRVGTHNAMMAYNIALKMANATLETSVWNKSAVSGNDELAEIIGLREYRLRRRMQGRARGPMIHEDAIPGFGNSWIRLKRQGEDPDNTNTPLYSRDVDIAKVDRGSGSYAAFGPGILNRYKALANSLLNRAPEPGEITLTSLQEAVQYFNTSDPQTEEEKRNGDNIGKLGLRVWWIAGVVDMALADESLNWDRKALDDLRIAVSHYHLSGEAGSFISEDQWKWIEEATNFAVRSRLLNAVRFVEDLSYSGGKPAGKRKK